MSEPPAPGEVCRRVVRVPRSVADAMFDEPDTSQVTSEAYLLVRGLDDQIDVFRLKEQGATTVSRDPQCDITLDDGRCSRHHFDLCWQAGAWYARDLQSRNGTAVNGDKITVACALKEGDRLRCGETSCVFTQDLSRPFDRWADVEDVATDSHPEAGAGDPVPSRPDPSDPAEDPSGTRVIDEELRPEPGAQILQRKSQTRYITESGLADSRDSSVRSVFRQLYGLIVRMMAAPNVRGLARTTLEGLLAAVEGDIGALLLFPSDTPDTTDPDSLQIVSFLAPNGAAYQRVSGRLSRVALTEGEAILAMDLRDSGEDGEFKTLHEMNAQSVICAPLRHEQSMLGLLHVYSMDDSKSLDADALEFALAVADQLALTVNNLTQRESLSAGLRIVNDENRSLRRLLEFESELIGESDVMNRLRDTIARVASSDATALVRGESGVGKELVARAIHFNSNRRQEPFVCLNCAALTETLLESELFGHEKGSFTGATAQKIGKFEQADGGTLFLDEVGELPLPVQAKFLRVLEGHPFERVGGNASVHVDVRVVAATNRELESAVQDRHFRRDLFYRLQIIEVDVPLLRDHASDIPALAEFFLQRCGERADRSDLRLSADAVEGLCGHDWPGNVRELRNVIERAVVLADGSEIQMADLRFSSLDGQPIRPIEYRPTSLEELETEHIVRTLSWTRWKKREAGRILGINRSTLDRKLERYGIDPRT